MENEGSWVSILEYTSLKKSSISTVRRAIKAGHVKYKSENGKYLIWTTKSIKSEIKTAEALLKNEVELLRKRNRELQEELNDLKMLLQVYEHNVSITFPPLPEIEL